MTQTPEYRCSDLVCLPFALRFIHFKLDNLEKTYYANLHINYIIQKRDLSNKLIPHGGGSNYGDVHLFFSNLHIQQYLTPVHLIFFNY